jgi:hypothetical protein
MPPKIRTLLLALAVIFVLAVLTVIIVSTSRIPQRPPLPNPNGHDDFLKAAALLTGDVGNASTLNHDGLQALVSTNSEALRMLRLGLTRDCSVPTESAMENVPGMLTELSDMKRLVQLLAAEGRLREMDNRLADAAQCYLDAIHFGNQISRGGFIIHRLVGIACEAIGDTPLGKLAPRLSSQEARRVIAELEKAENAEVTWDEVRQNENRFVEYRLSQGFHPITWVMTRWEVWRARQRAEIKHKRVVAHLRLLIAELALRCYQSEQGRAPTGLKQLVPKYLQRVPADPFSGQPLVYRPQDNYWLLYSVGENGVDDGGKRVGRSVSGTVPSGDIFYDSPY